MTVGILKWAAIVFVTGMVGCGAEPRVEGLRDDTPDRAQIVCARDLLIQTKVTAVGAPARDVAVVPFGGYAVATTKGVVEVHPCTYERMAGCDDRDGAASILRVEGRSAVYARANGTYARCDLREAVMRELAPEVALATTSHAGPVGIENSEAFLRPAGLVPRRLSTPDAPLDIAFSAELSLVAVSDRSGGVSLFNHPAGLPLARYAEHSRNAYGVAIDTPRRRVLSVSGLGLLAIRPLSEAAQPPTALGASQVIP